VDYNKNDVYVKKLQSDGKTYGPVSKVHYTNPAKLDAFVKVYGPGPNSPTTNATRAKNISNLNRGATVNGFSAEIFFNLFNNNTPAFVQTSTSLTYTPPLVLDLEGDGIQTSGVNNSPVFFEYEQSGYKQQTGWTTDAILINDANQNNIVDNSNKFLRQPVEVFLAP
jgi:hypothetical protein